MFTGDGTPGNNDGLASSCRLFQPTGICSEFSSVVHYKSQVSTALQYARDFGSTAKESLKRTTAWSAYYYTSRGSWYPVPERSLGLFEIP